MKKTRLVLVLFLLVLILSNLSAPVAAQSPVNCNPNGDVQSILNQITESGVAKWIRDLSGENPVIIGTQEYRIKTRFTSELFNPLNNGAKAYPYIVQELESFGYAYGSTLQGHNYAFKTYAPVNLVRTIPNPAPIEIEMVGAKNLVLTIPGHGPNANQQVLMTAHLDSTTNYDGDPRQSAPGAEDNASGISALMEAARLFRYYKFDRTIKIIFFTGEEQGLHGSSAYVNDFRSEMSTVLGVVNLDMFGYDSDRDKCMELHVGTMAASNTVGTCFTSTINNYNLGVSVDYLTSEAIRASDHAPFWDAGVGAVEVLENYDTHSSSYGCNGVRDRNPNYHKTTDKISNMYLPATHRIVQAGVGTVASLAGPMGTCFANDPVLTATPQQDSILLSWPVIEGAGVYRIYRGTKTCGGDMPLLAEVTTNSYVDSDIVFDQPYFYTVLAAEAEGVCLSKMSNCAITKVPKPEEPPVVYYQYLPLVIATEE